MAKFKTLLVFVAVMAMSISIVIMSRTPLNGWQAVRPRVVELSTNARVVHFWTYPCASCEAEHYKWFNLPEATSIGLGMDDAQMRSILGSVGNPFVSNITDKDWSIAAKFGVRGAPETWLLDSEGRVAYRHIGPLSDASITQMLTLLETLP